MTQMLLFDAPTDAANTNLVPAAEPVVHSAGKPAADETNVAAQLQHDGGVHHMGDLARLVLLRYDLVAKRRALMAARKAARAAK